MTQLISHKNWTLCHTAVKISRLRNVVLFKQAGRIPVCLLHTRRVPQSQNYPEVYYHFHRKRNSYPTSPNTVRAITVYCHFNTNICTAVTRVTVYWGKIMNCTVLRKHLIQITLGFKRHRKVPLCLLHLTTKSDNLPCLLNPRSLKSVNTWSILIVHWSYTGHLLKNRC